MKKRNAISNDEKELDDSIRAINDVPVDIIIPSAATVEEQDTIEQQRLASIRQQAKLLGDKGNNAADAIELLPDLGYGMEIIKSAIRNPNNSTDSDIDIRLETTLLNDTEKNAVLAVINTFAKDELNINKTMNAMIEDVLFLRGSYTTLCMPVGLYEHVIRGNIGPGLESFNSSMKAFENTEIGFVEKPTTKMFDISIHDDIRMLTASSYKRKQAQNKAEANLQKSYGLNSYKVPVRNSADGEERPIVTITKKDIKASISEKYAINTYVSADGFIPIFASGDTTDPIAGYIVLGEDYHAINAQRDGNMLEEMKSASEKDKQDFINRAKKEMGLSTATEDKSGDVIEKAFKDNMDKMITESLRNNPNSDRLEVDCPKSVYKAMMARAFKKMKTKLVYVDGDLINYVTHFKTPSGIGESLLEKTSLYSSLRIILRLGRINSYMENSTASTNIDVNVDAKETDPMKLAHEVANAYANMNADALPLGHFNLTTLQERLRLSRVKINLKGPGIPETSSEISHKSSDKSLPDTDLEEMLKKDQFAIIGAPADLVDKAYEGDFAEGIKVSGMMMERRISEYQETFQIAGGEIIQMNIGLSSGLQADILACLDQKTLEENPDIIIEIIKAIGVKFPSPDSTKLENQKQAFDLIEELAEDVSMAYFNEDGLGELMDGDNIKEKIDAFRIMTKNALIRDWCQDNNVLPEFANLLNPDNPNNIATRTASHIGNLYTIMSGTIKEVLGLEFKNDKVLAKVLRRLEIKQDKLDETLDAMGPEEEPVVDAVEPESDDNTDETVTDEEGTDDIVEPEATDVTPEIGDDNSGEDDLSLPEP